LNEYNEFKTEDYKPPQYKNPYKDELTVVRMQINFHGIYEMGAQAMLKAIIERMEEIDAIRIQSDKNAQTGDIGTKLQKHVIKKSKTKRKRTHRKQRVS